MSWKPNEERYLMKLSEALKLLPNVKPRKARWILNDIHDFFLENMYEHYNEGLDDNQLPDYIFDNINFRLSYSDFKELMVDSFDEVVRITPNGASLLIALYNNYAFEMKKKKDGISAPDELDNYSKSEEAIRNKIKKDRKKEEEKQKQEEYWIKNPNELPEALFTASRLNKIMIENVGLGISTSMTIGGISVYKDVHFYYSNSRKNSDSEVIISWTGSDGVEHDKILRTTRYKHNRRNDPNRN